MPYIILLFFCGLGSAELLAGVPAGTRFYQDLEQDGLHAEEEILSGAWDADFHPVTTDSRLNIGYTKDVIWFQVSTPVLLECIRNDQVLSMDYALNDRVTLFVARPNGDRVYQKSIGKSVKFAERAFKSRFLQFDLAMLRQAISNFSESELQTLRVFLKVESSGSVNAGFKIQDLREVTRDNYNGAKAALIYLGMATVIFLYNTLIMLVARSTSYLYYIAFVLAISLMTLCLQGTAFELFWPEQPEFNSFAGMFFSAMTGLTLSLMNLTNFNRQLDAYYPRFKIFLKCVIAYFFCMMILAPINVRWANIPVLLGILTTCSACLVFYVALAFRRDRQGYFYLVSMGFVIGSGFLTVARMMALVPSNIIFDNSYLFGSAVEMTLISLALGDKYRQIGLEQKRTHKQMIEMQKNSIVELDQKVSARTADLQQKAQEVRGILNALDSAVFVVQKRDINATEFTVGDTTSATAAKLFGEEALQTDFNPLAALDRMVLPGERDKIAAIASVYHAAIHEDELNFSLNSQLTCAVVRLRSGQVYKLSSAPVVEKGQNIVRGIVLSVTDISEAVARDEAHHHMAAKTEAIEATIAAGRDQAEKLLVQLKLIRNSMLELVGKGDCGIQQTIFSGCQQQLMRDLHTLKGFARTYGFEALSSHIHALESRVQALPAVDNNLQDVHDIAQNFLRKMQIYEWAYFIIHRHETDAVEGKDLIKVFQDMVQQLDSFARARKNVELIADTEGPSVYVSSAEAAIFDRAMIHIVRNSIDHGVAEDGVGHCQVKLRVEESGRRLVYSDNGRGLNLSLILDRAQQSGTSNAYESLSDHDAAMLIFKPGFSTKAKVDDVSGRGVGMDAVRNDMQRLGFHADIRIVNVSQRDGQKMAQVEFIFFKAA